MAFCYLVFLVNLYVLVNYEYEKKNKITDLAYYDERETYMFRNAILYYYYVSIAVVGFRRVREEKTNILLVFPRT